MAKAIQTKEKNQKKLIQKWWFWTICGVCLVGVIVGLISISLLNREKKIEADEFSVSMMSSSILLSEVYRNGEELEEKYLSKNVVTDAEGGQFIDIVVPENTVFVMGDNRWRTTDSLCCFWIQCYEWANYIVPDNYLIWKVWIRLYPHYTKF